MKITDAPEAAKANDRFNCFHDGYVRGLAFSIETEMMEFHAIDGSTFEDEVVTGTLVEIDVAHTNYDYPNQPENRLVLIRASGCIELFQSFLQFLETNIFDLRFEPHDKGLACLLTYHSSDVGMVQSLENGTQVTLFVAKSVQIEESTYDMKS